VARVVDDQGRVFGRINLIDAAIVAAVLVLLPLGYATYLLFRTPAPTITSVNRAPVTRIEERAVQGNVAGKLKVSGTGLRPMLRATIDDRPALAFLYESPLSADVLFGDVGEGSHDLVLYDGVREVARARAALVVALPAPRPRARVRVVGVLIDLDEATARALRIGQKFPETGAAETEIVALGEVTPDVRHVTELNGIIDVEVAGRVQRPASVVVWCEPAGADDCRVNGVQPGMRGLLALPGAPATLTLRMEEAVPADPPTPGELVVRFVVPAELAEQVRDGDGDESVPPLDARTAVMTHLGTRRAVAGDATVPMVNAIGIGTTFWRAQERLVSFDAVVRLGLDRTSQGGWRYRLQPIVLGGMLRFVTRRYVIAGTVIGVSPPPAASSSLR